MFVVMFKAQGTLNCHQQVFGPFADYLDAEEFLASGLPLARDCDWKYIHELDVPGVTPVQDEAWLIEQEARANDGGE